MMHLLSLRFQRIAATIGLAIAVPLLFPPSIVAQDLTLRGHELALASIAYSPDGKYVASGSYDRTARIWDAETGMQVAVLRGHGGPVEEVAFSLDAKLP